MNRRNFGAALAITTAASGRASAQQASPATPPAGTPNPNTTEQRLGGQD